MPWKVKAFFVETPRWDVSTEGDQRVFDMRSARGWQSGQRAESSLGLLFYNARWYDPALGRFVQADTIIPGVGNPQAFDRYAYTLNNPMKYVDPSGHGVICNEEGECWMNGRPTKPLFPMHPTDSLLEDGYEWKLITTQGQTTSYYTPSASTLFNGKEYDPDPNNWKGSKQYDTAQMEGSVSVDGKLWMYDLKSGIFKPGASCGGYPQISLGCLDNPYSQNVDDYIIQQVDGAVAACPPSREGTIYCGQYGFNPAYQQGGPNLYVTFNNPQNANLVLVVNPIDSGGGLGATQIDIYGGFKLWVDGPWVSNANVWIQLPIP